MAKNVPDHCLRERDPQNHGAHKVHAFCMDGVSVPKFLAFWLQNWSPGGICQVGWPFDSYKSRSRSRSRGESRAGGESPELIFLRRVSGQKGVTQFVHRFICSSRSKVELCSQRESKSARMGPKCVRTLRLDLRIDRPGESMISYRSTS